MKAESSQTVNRALQLLNLYTDTEELGISELSVLMDLNKTSVSRIVNSLEAGGFLQKNEDTRKYRLGIRLLYMGTLVEERNELAKWALPYMKRISEEFQVNSILSILENNRVRVIGKAISGPFIYMSARVGISLPAYSMASGKLLLAYSGTENIKAYLSKISLDSLTENTITNPNDFLLCLDQIFHQQYAEDNEESTIGLSCISVPIFGPSQNVLAALSLSGQTQIINASKATMLDALKQVANKISA